MRFKLLTIFFFINTIFCFSQNESQKNVDSLYMLIEEEKNNSNKIIHYQALCTFFYENEDYMAFEKCNNSLLDFAKKSKIIQAYAFYYSNRGLLIEDINVSKAIFYIEKGNQLFYSIKDWDNYIYSNFLIAKCFRGNKEYDKSINLINKTLNFKFIKKSKHLSFGYALLAHSYRSKNDYVNALYYAKIALKYKPSYIDMLKIYDIITLAYVKADQFDKAMEYCEMRIKFSKKVNDKFFSKWRKSQILCEIGRSQEAILLLMNCLEYYKKYGNNADVVDTQNVIAYAYLNLGNYNKANFYINEALKDRLEQNTYYRVNDFAIKASISIKLNDIKTAKFFINESLKSLDSTFSFVMIKYVYETKIIIEKKRGNYNAVSFYQEKLIKITEEKYKKDNNSKLHQLEVDLDVTEKNNRIKNLQIAQLKKQVEINTKSDYIMYISIVLLIAVASVFAYMKNYNTIKIKNVLIENEKLLVKKSLLEKETLLKEIHHRVKNNMQLVISLLKIQARDSKELSIENFIEVSENRIRSMALIHEYLYESENINYVNFEEYVNRLSSSIRGSFSNQSTIKLETQINNTHFMIETAIPLGLIINELVINAFKHAFAGKDQGIIKIILFKEEDLHHLEITDNGIGIDTIQENGPSIGLRIVKLLVSQINGQMQIIKDSGTKFTIQFKDINSTHE